MGNVIYGQRPGRRDDYIYLLINNRAFKIYSYTKQITRCMDADAVQNLLIELNKHNIKYSFIPDGYECLVTGTSSNPAHYRVIFNIGSFGYIVKNYNCNELTLPEVEAISSYLNNYIHTEIASIRGNTAPTMAYAGYAFSGRETAIDFEPKDIKSEEKHFKPLKDNKPISMEFEQLNLFSMLQLPIYR